MDCAYQVLSTTQSALTLLPIHGHTVTAAAVAAAAARSGEAPPAHHTQPEVQRLSGSRTLWLAGRQSQGSIQSSSETGRPWLLQMNHHRQVKAFEASEKGTLGATLYGKKPRKPTAWRIGWMMWSSNSFSACRDIKASFPPSSPVEHSSLAFVRGTGDASLGPG